MKRYLKIYFALCKMSLQMLLAYRANFINSLLSSFAWGFFSFVSILLLTSKTNSIYGWTKIDIFLLTCGYQIIIGVFHTFFSRNFERMADVINLGQLDTLLVKPMDSQFMLSFWWINYTSIIRILLGIVFLVYFVHSASIRISLFSTIIFICLSGIGLLLLYSIWFIMATLIIWYPRMSNIVELMYTVTGVSRYPGEMYQKALGSVFFLLLPIIVVVTIPVKFLVSKVSLQEILLMMTFAGGFLFISRRFWKFALRFYTSASS